MNIKEEFLDRSKYSLKCPYEMEPKFIIVHNTANDASAKNEIAYMKNNASSTSYHLAVDDVEAIQAIPFNRNTWNCGDGKNGNGNRNGISMEICYSKSGGAKWEKARANAIELIVRLLKDHGWGIEQVKKHQDFNGKYCPHRILDEGWENFLNEIRQKLGQATTVTIQKDTTVLEWQKMMNKVYNCKLAEDNCFGPDCTKKANTYCLYYKKPIITNEHVKFIQDRLCKKGFVVDIDGKFGPDCNAKTLQFQKSMGLTQDGKIGANTTKELLK